MCRSNSSCELQFLSWTAESCSARSLLFRVVSSSHSSLMSLRGGSNAQGPSECTEQQLGLWSAVERRDCATAVKWLDAGAGNPMSIYCVLSLNHSLRSCVIRQCNISFCLSDPNLCCSPEVHKLELNALHMASGRGDLDMIRTLLHAGADVNFTNVRGYTPLHFAALQGQQETCQLLVEVC